MMKHDEIMAYSTRARKEASKESGIWSQGTEYTAESLEAMYEGYVILELEAGKGPDDLWDFPDWCEHEMKIPNE